MDMTERLAKLETSVDWIKVIGAILVAVQLGGFTLLSAQIISLGARIDGTANRLDGRIDSLNSRLTEEFRAMRAEMSAQTSAIANSITATKQVQPQIIVMPPPAPASPK